MMKPAKDGDMNGRSGAAPEGEGREPAPVEWEHLVQFYENDDFLCDSVADFLSDGLVADEPLVVLSTVPHRDALIERLESTGFDWQGARLSRRLRWLDARAALETIMIGRAPDAARFEEHIGGIIRASLDGGARPRVRAYGEMVDLVWREGNAEAALRIEDLWNDLARSHAFSLLCAYSMGNVYRESRGPRYREVCGRHAHVLPSETGRPPVPAE